MHKSKVIYYNQHQKLQCRLHESVRGISKTRTGVVGKTAVAGDPDAVDGVLRGTEVSSGVWVCGGFGVGGCDGAGEFGAVGG